MIPFLPILREANILSIFFRFTLCIICGGIVGFEREKRMHAAGLRTHILVCLGSATAILISQYIYTYLGQTVDTTRIAAQVISGVGFLGVGTIIVTGTKKVTGLTTAAGLWAASCMGLALGIGFYECAILLCFAVYFSLKILNTFERKYLTSKKTIGVFLEHDNSFKISSIYKAIDGRRWAIYNLETVEANKDWGGSIKFIISRESIGEHFDNVSSIFSDIDGVLFVKESNI